MTELGRFRTTDVQESSKKKKKKLKIFLLIANANLKNLCIEIKTVPVGLNWYLVLVGHFTS